MKRHPYNLLLFTSLFLLLISIVIRQQKDIVDFHLHDTYFVIAKFHVFWLLAIWGLIEWLLYLITNKILYSKALSWTHIVITILTLLLFAYMLFFENEWINSAPRRYYDFSPWITSNPVSEFRKYVGVVIIVLLSGQFIFLINLIAGLSKKQIRRGRSDKIAK